MELKVHVHSWYISLSFISLDRCPDSCTSEYPASNINYCAIRTTSLSDGRRRYVKNSLGTKKIIATYCLSCSLKYTILLYYVEFVFCHICVAINCVSTEFALSCVVLECFWLELKELTSVVIYLSLIELEVHPVRYGSKARLIRCVFHLSL